MKSNNRPDMPTVLLNQSLWPEITRCVKQSPASCRVAVAYFGKGGAELLPLRKGSRLVVNASKEAVKLGQTCPDDLLKLVRRGVRIFSVENLHAKVFATGRSAFIGSANASKNSANALMEAAVKTTNASLIREARDFVEKLCRDEQTPNHLLELTKLYNPPKRFGFTFSRTKSGRRQGPRAVVSRFLIAKLRNIEWPENETERHEAGYKIARTRREHRNGYQLESFRYSGECPYREGDNVMQVMTESDSRVLVSPPGKVLKVQDVKVPRGTVSYVFLEVPIRRRVALKAFQKKLPPQLRNQCRGGLVKSNARAEAFCRAWNR